MIVGVHGEKECSIVGSLGLELLQSTVQSLKTIEGGHLSEPHPLMTKTSTHCTDWTLDP